MDDPPDGAWWQLESRRLQHAGLDAAVDDALATGSLRVSPTGATWEASHGTVRALRVTVCLDAELLGRVTRTPSTHDELVRALTLGLAERPHDALADVALAWDGTVRRPGGYRGDTRVDATPDEGIGAFLRGRGVLAPVAVTLRGDRAVAHADVSLDGEARAAVADAARLIARATRLTWG